MSDNHSSNEDLKTSSQTENDPSATSEFSKDESLNSDLIKANEELKNKILDLEKVIASLNDKLLRSLADADNIRKRSREEIEKTSKYALFNFASDLVLVSENFYLAVDNMPKEEIEKNPTVKHFADAIIMTKKELVKILEKSGIKRLYPLGEKFDHNYHEAISRTECDEEEDKIVQVIQAGYLINDRLIRPALVVVACPKSSS